MTTGALRRSDGQACTALGGAWGWTLGQAEVSDSWSHMEELGSSRLPAGLSGPLRHEHHCMPGEHRAPWEATAAPLHGCTTIGVHLLYNLVTLKFLPL